ncbi:extracellular solute-binding protein [uncultured Eubacterium sp.]|uniref:extracellular solute-binding protein n=1 Tax=uncultured Eubacterium sp. TaxID=165185 RepID=UPI0026717BE7|nr:extracellular solute-binding protein [uncultured Eubacterium sp.]
MKKKLSIGPKLYIALMFVFFYLPILVTMIFSFNSSKSLTKFTGLSLKWYQKLLTDNNIIAAVYVSISIAIIATAVSTILGTMTAIGLSRSRKVLREAILNVNNMPIMNPEIVTAIGLMILFTSARMERGYITMLLAHIMFCTPYVIVSVYPKVRSMDHNLANVAMDLGATPFQALTKVIIPILKPGIYAGMLLAFTMSIDDFVISYFVTGNGVSNISIVVYNMTKRTNPTINALSTLLILVVVIVLVIVNVIPSIVKKRKGKSIVMESTKPKFYKKIAGSVALVGMVAIAIFCVVKFSAINNKPVLRVFNSGEYMDSNLIEKFEKENDCDVVYETFDSNESMYTKLQSGSVYDVLVPSDYMIERLIKEDYLQPVDWSKITNKDKIVPKLLNNNFDKGSKYAVPYYWGTVGIVYNKKTVSKEDLQEGWNILRNKKYSGKIYMYDSERDSFMIALKALGYSMNTTNKSELQQAYEWLVEQNKTMKPVYVGDDVMDNMISGNKDMAVVYSGDGAYIISENSDMGFFVPEQGSNNWIDGMVITKSCKNTELAHKFINFFLQKDVAIQNTAYIGYDSAVKSVYEYYRNEEYAGNPGCAPDTSNPKSEEFKYQEQKIKEYCASLWTKVKSD